MSASYRSRWLAPAVRIAARACAASVMLASRAWTASADDASHGLHLSWVRGNEASACADAARVEADVERRLACSALEASARFDASVEAIVVRTETGWRASIAVRRTDGTLLAQREVESMARSCDSLARASALSIAL